jgi:hypothetical protein
LPATVRNLCKHLAMQVNVVDVIVRRGHRFTRTAVAPATDALFERAVRLHAR